MESVFKTKKPTNSTIILTALINVIVLIAILKIGELVSTLIGLTFLVTFYLIRPIKYTIDKTGISIKKTIYSTRIEYYNLIEINETSYDDLSIRMRLFASGGFWGYFGIFSSSKYGNINFQSSNLNNLVLIKSKGKLITVISPENREKFINTIKYYQNIS